MPRQRSSRTPLLPGRGPLSRVPPVVVFFVILGMFGAGVAVGGPAGAALLGLLVLLVLGLLTVTWRTLTSAERVMRVVVLLVLLTVAVVQLR